MYDRPITEASKSALLELSLALRRYRNEMTLAGGWAPYFITKNFFNHCGSVDIDFVLKTEIMEKYETIKKTVLDLGYTQENEFRFIRTVSSPIDKKSYPIHVDFLCDSEGLKYTNVRRVQKDLSAFVFSGLNIAFDFNYEDEIATVVPSGGEDRVKIKIANFVSSMALKGHAVGGRLNDKDCYDVYALTFHSGNAENAAAYFNSQVKNRNLSKEKLEFMQLSLDYIRDAFQSERSRSAYQVAYFIGQEDIRFDVATRVKNFLNGVSLPFK